MASTLADFSLQLLHTTVDPLKHLLQHLHVLEYVEEFLCLSIRAMVYVVDNHHLPHNLNTHIIPQQTCNYTHQTIRKDLAHINLAENKHEGMAGQARIYRALAAGLKQAAVLGRLTTRLNAWSTSLPRKSSKKQRAAMQDRSAQGKAVL